MEERSGLNPEQLCKFKRRLIRSVAWMLIHQKMPEAAVWEELNKVMGCNCVGLWEHMRSLTLKKLKLLLSAEDKICDINDAARMSLSDWQLYDQVLVHEDLDVIGVQDMAPHKADNKALIDLFGLVQRFDIEAKVDAERADAWTAATVYYNSQGHQCSPMLLQKRWYQLKAETRRRFYLYWNCYRGSVRHYLKAEPYRPTVLLRTLAKRFPEVITQKFPSWETSIEQNLIILPDDFESRKNMKVLTSTDEKTPDLIVMEPFIETIDLLQASDSDQENSQEETAGNNDNCDRVPFVQIKVEPEDPIIDVTEENQKINKTQAAMAQVVEEESLIDRLNDDIIELAAEENDLINIASNCENKLKETDKTTGDQDTENNEQFIPRITNVFGNVFMTDETLSIIDNLTKLGQSATENNDAMNEGDRADNVKQIIAEGAICTRVDIPSIEDVHAIQGEVHISEKLSKETSLGTDVKLADDAVLVGGGKDAAVLSKISDAVSIENNEPNTGGSDMNRLQYGNLDLSSFGDIPEHLNFADDGIEYNEENGEDADENIVKVESEVDEVQVAENTSLNRSSSSDNQELKLDEKLFLDPVVYTMKLDHMKVLKNKPIDAVNVKSLVNKIVDESKPISDRSVDAEKKRIDKLRISLSSYMLQKPKNRKYNPIQLCKNPDFNTRLKRLTAGFLSSWQNRALIKACKPLTIDMTKTFESRLVDNTIYLKKTDNNNVVEIDDEEKTTVMPSVIPIQTLIDNTRMDDVLKLTDRYRTNSTHSELEETCLERNRVINLPDITQVRRINQSLLTAEVSPIQIPKMASGPKSIIASKSASHATDSHLETNLNSTTALDVTINENVDINKPTTPKIITCDADITDTMIQKSYSLFDMIKTPQNPTLSESSQNNATQQPVDDSNKSASAPTETQQRKRPYKKSTVAHPTRTPWRPVNNSVFQAPWIGKLPEWKPDEFLITTDTLQKMLMLFSGKGKRQIEGTIKKSNTEKSIQTKKVREKKPQRKEPPQRKEIPKNTMDRQVTENNGNVHNVPVENNETAVNTEAVVNNMNIANSRTLVNDNLSENIENNGNTVDCETIVHSENMTNKTIIKNIVEGNRNTVNNGTLETSPKNVSTKVLFKRRNCCWAKEQILFITLKDWQKPKNRHMCDFRNTPCSCCCKDELDKLIDTINERSKPYSRNEQEKITTYNPPIPVLNMAPEEDISNMEPTPDPEIRHDVPKIIISIGDPTQQVQPLLTYASNRLKENIASLIDKHKHNLPMIDPIKPCILPKIITIDKKKLGPNMLMLSNATRSPKSNTTPGGISIAPIEEHYDLNIPIVDETRMNNTTVTPVIRPKPVNKKYELNIPIRDETKTVVPIPPEIPNGDSFVDVTITISKKPKPSDDKTFTSPDSVAKPTCTCRVNTLNHLKKQTVDGSIPCQVHKTDIAKPSTTSGIPKSINQKEKILILNSQQMAKVPFGCPIFLGNNKILLTNVPLPRLNKEEPKPILKNPEANNAPPLPLPHGVQLVLLPNGKLTYAVTPGVELSPEDKAYMPILIETIQRQMTLAGSQFSPIIRKPNTITTSDEIVNISDDETPSTQEDTVPSSVPSTASDVQKNAIITNTSNNSDQSKETISSTAIVKMPSNEPSSSKPITLVSTDVSDKNIVHSQDIPQTPTKTVNHENENLENYLSSSPNTSAASNAQTVIKCTSQYVYNHDVNVSTSSLPNDDGKSNANNDLGVNVGASSSKKTILSDLMEMSGISAEDTAPVQPEPVKGEIQTTPNPTNVMPSTNEVPNESAQLPNELNTISSFSELKYAVDKNAQFFKLDVETGLVVPINVCVKKKPPLSELRIAPKKTIDLTGDIDICNDDDIVEIKDPETNSKNNNVAIKMPKLKILDKRNFSMFKSIQRPRILKRIDNTSLPAHLQKIKSLLRPSSELRLLPVVKNSEKIPAAPQKRKSEDEPISLTDSSDDEPLIKKVRRKELLSQRSSSSLIDLRKELERRPNLTINVCKGHSKKVEAPAPLESIDLIEDPLSGMAMRKEDLTITPKSSQNSEGDDDICILGV